MPKQDAPEETLKVYTLDQTKRLLQFAEDDYQASKAKHLTKEGNIIRFSAFTGMDIASLQTLVLIHIGIFGGLRRGELLGLDWPAIDFERNMVHVKQSAARAGGEEFVKAPKSKCSLRSVVLPQPVMDLLAEWRHEQERYKAAIGDKWCSTEECVFIQANGNRMSIGTPYSRFQKLVKKYNATVSEDMQLPVLSLHCLRHTNASLLVRSKV